eukprot:3644788-Amphidinium_carterae.1
MKKSETAKALDSDECKQQQTLGTSCLGRVMCRSSHCFTQSPSLLRSWPARKLPLFQVLEK